MVEMTGGFHPRLLVNVFEIIPEIFKVPKMAQVTFKMTVINGIEAQQGGEQTNVGFREAIAA